MKTSISILLIGSLISCISLLRAEKSQPLMRIMPKSIIQTQQGVQPVISDIQEGNVSEKEPKPLTQEEQEALIKQMGLADLDKGSCANSSVEEM